jgi:hypothetical protein
VTAWIATSAAVIVQAKLSKHTLKWFNKNLDEKRRKILDSLDNVLEFTKIVHSIKR